MIPAGKDPDRVTLHRIHEPMLVIDAPGPATGQFVLERLGLAGSGEGCPLNLLDQFDQWQHFLAILLNPPGQILEGRGIKCQAFHKPHRTGCLFFAAGLPEDAPAWPRS